MPSSGFGAVAVDLGASSGRFASGVLRDGRIDVTIVEQIRHHPRTWNGREVWDFDALEGIVRRAAAYGAAHFERASMGIDTWGVDFGCLDERGELMQPVVCYRDPTNVAAAERLHAHHAELYALTGIQHQPFNTLYQLAARAVDDPTLPTRCRRWLLLPDLFAHRLGASPAYEQSIASSTAMMGLTGRWQPEAFDLAGWPVPDLEPSITGVRCGVTREGVDIVRVGGHDTSSAVFGLGRLDPDAAFLNVGTWTLLGRLLDRPLATAEARDANFTNERANDGQIRFLCNIAGFWVINRLHQELGIAASVPEWLQAMDRSYLHTASLLDPSLYNPDSMVGALAALVPEPPQTPAQWATLGLASLAQSTADQVCVLEHVTGAPIRRLRVAGGGSASVEFCQELARRSGREIVAGPVEATVLGNLAQQFLTMGEIRDRLELEQVLARSADLRTYASG
ncbi:MAG: rhamnulokinase [Fimbriimonadaceae bacterium]